MEPLDPLVLVLPHPEIDALNLRPYLRRFGVDALAKGAEFDALMGAFNFIVHGYDDDPQEVYAIEEVRAYYRKLREEWPYWLFFCDLRTEVLLMMTLCRLRESEGSSERASSASCRF
jgi:hypothetical protein